MVVSSVVLSAGPLRFQFNHLSARRFARPAGHPLLPRRLLLTGHIRRSPACHRSLSKATDRVHLPAQASTETRSPVERGLPENSGSGLVLNRLGRSCGSYVASCGATAVWPSVKTACRIQASRNLPAPWLAVVLVVRDQPGSPRPSRSPVISIESGSPERWGVAGGGESFKFTLAPAAAVPASARGGFTTARAARPPPSRPVKRAPRRPAPPRPCYGTLGPLPVELSAAWQAPRARAFTFWRGGRPALVARGAAGETL